MTGGWLWLAFVAAVVGTLFSTLYHALRDLSRSSLESLADRRGDPKTSGRVERILADIDAHADAVALPRIVCNLLLAVSIVFHFRAVFDTAMATWVPVSLGIGITSLVLWVFGVAIPHSVARHAGAMTVYAWSRTIRACFILSTPFQPIINAVDEIVRRLTGSTKDPAAIASAEVLSVVEDAQQDGQFDETERDMIEAVMRFRDKTVAQIMTPRTEMEAMQLTNNLGEVTQIIRKGGHSRIPVYDGSPDAIVGVFYVKDLMRWLAGEGRGSKSFELKAILRPAMFVPETKTIRELLTELIQKKVHLALVADEYGGTAGLVTIEDIIEEIVGEIQDEYEHGEDGQPEIRVDHDTRSAEIDARAYVDDANYAMRALNITLPASEDYDTVGGCVTVTLGRIPAAGEQLRVGSALVTVLEAEPTRVTRVKLEAVGASTEPRGNERTGPILAETESASSSPPAEPLRESKILEARVQVPTSRSERNEPAVSNHAQPRG